MRRLIERVKLRNRLRRARMRRYDPAFHEAEIFLTERFLTGGTALDIGANKGLYTQVLAQCADHVVAFEPNPKLAKNLRLALPTHVEIINAAVSDKAGQMILSIPQTQKGGSSPNTASLEPITGPVAERLTVDVIRLDDLDMTDLRFVKIDVEGHEASVIKGARKLIARERPILLMEFNDSTTDSAVWLFNYFADLDYVGAQLINDDLRALPSRPTHLSARNVLFFPKERMPSELTAAYK